MNDDAQLLCQYLEGRSEQAFGQIVQRHINVVYSAARRMVGGDPHLAQDVAQTVFADLARKAWGLPRGVVLAGWLYRHACFTASKMVRTERRRAVRERVAVEMTALQDQTEAGWEQIAPLLDEALNGLSASDRDAIVLRFFQGQNFRSVGDALGVSEDTAQKRVSRALEKLRLFFKRRGSTLTAATLATALATEAVATAPAGLAASVTAASLATAAAAGAGVSLTVMKLMAVTKLKAAIVGALVIASVATPLALQRQSLNQARRENLALRAEAQELARLREENKRLAQVQIATDELDQLRREHTELLRLRGQLAALRNRNEELARLRAARPGDPRPTASGGGSFVPAANVVDAGLATPEAAMQTLAWALVNQDQEKLKELMDFDKLKEAMHEARHKLDPDFNPDEQHEDNFDFNSWTWNTTNGGLAGFQILSQQLNSADEAELEVAVAGKDGSRDTNRFNFHRVEEEWKLDLLTLVDTNSLYFTNTVPQPDGSEKPFITKLKVEERKERKLVPVEESAAKR